MSMKSKTKQTKEREAIFEALCKLPVIEEAKLDYFNVPMEFFPNIDGTTETIVDYGLMANALGYDIDNPNNLGLEIEQHRGNILNTALDVLCSKFELEPPFWSVANESKLEKHLRLLEVHSEAIYNLYWILREMLEISATKGQWKSKINQNSFYMLLEDSLPRTRTTKSLNRKRISSLLRKKSDGKNEEYPVFSLFDIIYLTLRSNAVVNGSVHLKECALCQRLFFPNRTDRKLCLLDEPSDTCETRYNRDKGNAESRKNATYAKAARLIEEQSLSVLKNESAHNTDLTTFRKSWNRLYKQLNKSEADIISRYNKLSDYLDAFIERYDPEIPIEELIEDSKEAVGIKDQKDL